MKYSKLKMENRGTEKEKAPNNNIILFLNAMLVNYLGYSKAIVTSSRVRSSHTKASTVHLVSFPKPSLDRSYDILN